MSKLPIFEDKVFDKASEILPGDYDNCTFVNCQLAGGDLRERLFTDCTFRDCDLTNARLHESAMKTVSFEGCKLLGVHFDDCRDFLFKVNFSRCNLEFVTFREWKLKGTEFKDCVLRETDFTGADLQEASFDDCDLERAIFERTDLRKADFRSARNYRFSPEENRIKGTRFSVEGLPGLLAEYGIIV
ncbi:pentapeptide repeat-containing protein [Neolewinella aurantiaca]|uniref:Pentapeptide repeat-containing protein n=1 Tax=Neolewinella aurantiaca TaxID=2602767 RepID=A0A5C7FP37_9BACT|nr:pentapeptide repeat-containing protein [Neolewinella aurantiaca]TXF89413.1 pentapeptide repeat-containing protein [Neolewinella aurantiaca]